MSPFSRIRFLELVQYRLDSLCLASRVFGINDP